MGWQGLPLLAVTSGASRGESMKGNVLAGDVGGGFGVELRHLSGCAWASAYSESLPIGDLSYRGSDGEIRTKRKWGGNWSEDVALSLTLGGVENGVPEAEGIEMGADRYEVTVYGRSDGRLVVKRRVVTVFSNPMEEVEAVTVVTGLRDVGVSGEVLRVRYGLERPGEVVLRLYGASGRLVRVLDEGWRRAGWHEVRVPLDRLPKGVYFLRFEGSGVRESRKVLVIR